MLGGIVLAGWWLDAPVLVRLGRTLPEMQVATALSFLAAGVGLAHPASTVRRLAGGFLCLIGIATMAAFLVDSPFVLHLMVPLPTLKGGYRGVLMAPTSALAFCFVGVALVLAAKRRPVTAVPAAALAVLGAGTLGLAVIDLIASAAHGLDLWGPTGRQMAIHTALGLAALGSALLWEAARLRQVTDQTPVTHAVLVGCIALVLTFASGHAIRVSQIAAVQQSTQAALANLTRALGAEPLGWDFEDDVVIGGLSAEVDLVAPGYVAVLRMPGGAVIELVDGAPPADGIFVERIGLPVRAEGTAALEIWPGATILRSSRRPVGLVVLVLGSPLAILLTVAIQAAATARARAARLQDALASLAASEARLHDSRKMEAVARLAGGVAHEFNNLLSVVRGYTQLLATEKDVSARESYVAEIDMASTRGAELTRRLLTVSARHVLHPEPVSMSAFLDTHAGMLRRVLGAERHFELNSEGAHEELRVSTDPRQLEQSLVTLAANARDATEPGGTFSVRVRPRALDADSADGIGVRPGWYVELEVADNGRGMTPDQLRSIFEPFGVSSKRTPGAGLGLAMVYGFARQSGGSVDVNSRAGRGTTFRILLPRAARTALRRVETTGAIRTRGARLVLVAEDEDAVRGLMVRILARAGYDVIAAVNGIDALARIAGREESLDLLLTDMIMPELGGRELAESLRGRRPSLPVLFMSGYADAEIDGGAVRGDPRATFLQKPFNPATLIEHIENLLDGAAALSDETVLALSDEALLAPSDLPALALPAHAG
jgi:signal transduction histidine kinase/DNA-binding NarL/FixJ family response regulator